MSKKEELAKQYSFNIPSEIYNTLETDADRLLWKSETERAFEAGWDSSIKNIKFVAKWNDAKRTLPEFNEDNNAVICVTNDNYVSLQRGKLADKTKLWCWLSDILPITIL